MKAEATLPLCFVCFENAVEPGQDQCDGCDPQGVNSGAELKPQSGPDERPAIAVAGALVFVYVDRQGCLTVSVDLEEAELLYGPVFDEERTVPLRVNVNDTVILSRDKPLTSCSCTYRVLVNGTTTLLRRDPECTVGHDR